MKFILLLFIASTLAADSKPDKALQSRIKVLEEGIKESSNERLAEEKKADARYRTLQQENARISMDNNGYRLQISNLTDANVALKSQLHSQADASKFEAGAIKSLAEHAGSNAVATATLGAAVKVAAIATQRQTQNSEELKKGTAMSTTAAESAQEAARLGEENRLALKANTDAVARHTVLITEIHKTLVLGEHLLVGMAIVLFVQFIVIFFPRGRK